MLILLTVNVTNEYEVNHTAEVERKTLLEHDRESNLQRLGHLMNQLLETVEHDSRGKLKTSFMTYKCMSEQPCMRLLVCMIVAPAAKTSLTYNFFELRQGKEHFIIELSRSGTILTVSSGPFNSWNF